VILLYQILFTLGFIVAAPFYFIRHLRRGNYRKGFAQRFGFYPSKIRNQFYKRGCIWFRAVSVGEVHEALTIIWRIHKEHPEIPMALSVTTTTGYQTARHRAPAGVAVTYYPVDFTICIERALKCFQPRLIVLVESDVWPNFMRLARSCRIPVALINARISQRSLRGYKLAQFWFGRVFRHIALATAPDQSAAKRLAEVGVPRERIHIVGSLKYEVAALGEHKPEVEPRVLLRAAGWKLGAPILVAGSTHCGEEEIFLKMFPRLREQVPDLFLVLAPRHAERGSKVAKLAEKFGVPCARRSQLKGDAIGRAELELSKTPPSSSQSQLPATNAAHCLLLDTTGELRGFYREATVIFVGKSLVGRGGQNILEASITGNPVVFGPHMENFAAISRELVDAGGAMQVTDAADLERALRELLGNESRRKEIAANAKQVFERNIGAASTTTEMLLGMVRGQF
jgi:3-deoxy-D-manno-octulosonic-acid transferase